MKIKTVSLQFPFPSINLQETPDRALEYVDRKRRRVLQKTKDVTDKFFNATSGPSLFKKIRKSLFFGIAVLAIIIGVAGIAKKGENPVEQKATVLAAKAGQDINKEFSFPLVNGKGEEVSNIKYIIKEAELRDEIIVKGKKATAIEGRVFLIFTLKIINEHNQSIEMDTRDYMRLSVNRNEEEWLAPDIHNDPVEIQAISTKNTRLGFPINDSDTNLVLRVGEINGEKEKISLDLK